VVAIRVPPGRTGRQWLHGRLAAAERAAELLERKAQLLRVEQRRYADAVERGSREWTLAAQDARTWTARATILAGERGLLLAATGERASTDVEWTTLMGVRYPCAARCVWPEGGGSGVLGSAAHVGAGQAHRRALAAAVRVAADEAAYAALTRELAATHRRIRALRRRWIPALHDQLAQVELVLEELDRAEIGTRRRAIAHDADDRR
jgi:V/A-type H+-transporting ATPase subunit D